jgi:hypothetical protein
MIIRLKVWVVMMVCLATVNTACAQRQPKGQDSALELSSYSVHLVQPKTPYKVRNAKNEVEEKKTAYLVFFDLKHRPAFYNTNLDFYIGDYKIPEYGGTATGIYFRVYDKALLKKLNNESILYATGRQPQKSLNKKFTVPEVSKLKAEPEEALLKKHQ